MATLLIVYGTTEGHTRKVAEHVAETVGALGHTAYVIDAARNPSLAGCDGAIVAASLHRGQHQAVVVRWVREHLVALRGLPTAFFSVSLTATLPQPEHQREAQACVDAFIEKTRWWPGMTFRVAGALTYSRYSFFTRRLMKRIARGCGYGTDTSRDYEFTDWVRLRRDTQMFLALLPAATPEEVAPAERLAAAGVP